MTIFRGYLPALTGQRGCLLAAVYRAVLMAAKQERLALDVRSVTTEKERAERDPAVVYWHKALFDSVSSQIVDLTDLQQCFLERPVTSGAGLAFHVKDIYSKLPSRLRTRLLGQYISCSCGAQTGTTFPMHVPAPMAGSRLVEFLDESASVCPLCRRRDTVLSSRVPVLIFVVSQEGCLRTGSEPNRAFFFAGLEYLTIGAIFAAREDDASAPLSLRAGVVSPLSGEAEMFDADGRISQHDTGQFRLWLDGGQESIEGLMCIGMFLLNKRIEGAKRSRKRRHRKASAERGSRVDASHRVQSDTEYSSYADESDYQYSYSDSSNRRGYSGEQKDRRAMGRDDRRDGSMTRNRDSMSESTDGYQVAAVRVNRDDGLYHQTQASSQNCTCCGSATITALWIMVGVVGGITLINFILICVLFSQLR